MRLKNVLYSGLVFTLAIILTYGTSPIDTSGFGPAGRQAQPYTGGPQLPFQSREQRRARDVPLIEGGQATGGGV